MHTKLYDVNPGPAGPPKPSQPYNMITDWTKTLQAHRGLFLKAKKSTFTEDIIKYNLSGAVQGPGDYLKKDYGHSPKKAIGNYLL